MEASNNMTVNELMNKFKSKQDLYQRLTIDCKIWYKFIINIVQYHLPSYRMCPINFIKEILSGEKAVR